MNNSLPVLAASIIVGIVAYNNHRERSQLKRAALVRPENSPWSQLYMHGDDDSFLHVTGLGAIGFKFFD
jgi:hypothetical protein